MGSLTDNVPPAPGLTARRRFLPTLAASTFSGRACSPLLLLVALLLLVSPGCTSMPHNTVSTIGGDAEGARLDQAPEPERITALTREIRMLSPKVDPREAADCARRSIKYSDLLKQAYHITEPIELNNIEVNMGLKKRGLCYQLADDLQAELKSQHYKTLTFQRATANWDDLWSEHNCVVVTAPGQPFKKGLVLDVWRNAGRLRWARVDRDHYPWIPRNPGNAVIASSSSSPSTKPATGG